MIMSKWMGSVVSLLKAFITRSCSFSTRACLSQGIVTHGRALSNDRFYFGEIAPRGHVTIGHGRVMAEGFYVMAIPYDDFLIILVIFLAF